MNTDRYTVETVVSLHQWTPKLFSFRTTRSDGFRFVAGQFARLGVSSGDKTVWRAFSMVSSSYEETLEFFAIVVPNGEFTSELTRLRVGDSLMVDKTAYGFLTLDRFHDGADLWLLATGTGVAPFISMLREPEIWQRYENIVLTYSVREGAELAYQDEIAAWLAPAHSRLRFVPVVTREQVAGALSKRITHLLLDGDLEARAGLAIDSARSRVLLCGNPEMVSETRQILQGRGLALARARTPGQLAMEQFW